MAFGEVSYTVVQEDILGPPLGISGSGSPKLTDTATSSGHLPWWNPANPDSALAAGAGNTPIDVEYLTQQVVSKTANVTQGTINTRTTFNITVSNGGEVLLNRTELTDLLPKGLTFISASPDVTSSTSNLNGTTTLYWSNLSQSFERVLDPGKQFNVLVTAYFSGAEYGTLTNFVTSKGYNLRREATTSSSSMDVYALNQNIAVVKTSNITSGSPGAPVNFTLDVHNTGGLSLEHVFVSDLLPDGMSYVSSSPVSTNSGPNVYWSDIGQIAIDAHKQLWVNALIDGPIEGSQTLTNRVDVNGKPDIGANVTNSSNASVNAQEAKIAVTKTANLTVGSPGTSVTFTLLVKNTGNATLQHVFVSDILPAGMSYVSSTSGSVHVGQNVSWSDVGPILSGANKSLQIVAHIDGPITGTRNLTNHVAVSGKPENGQNVTSNSSADVQAQEAKISITKTANPTVGSPSTNVTFTLLVRNTGSAALQHVFVSDILPAGMSYVSSTSGSVHVGQNVSWSDVGPILSGANKSLQIVAHIDGPIIGTRNLTNHVDVSGKPENGQNVTSNSSADVQAQEAKISITKTANPKVGSPSTNVTFTLLVKNTGNATLQHVFVSDILPAGMSYVSSTSGGVHAGQNVSWSDIGPLSSSANKSLQIVAHIDGPITGTRNLTNHVAVSGKPENGQNVTSNSSADVQAQEAKISVTKTANPTVGSPSTNVTFTLLVENTGSAALQHVFVSDLLPAGMSYVSSTSGSTHTGQNVSWSDIGPLLSGKNKSLQIVAHIDGPITGTRNLTNHVAVSGKPENGQNVTSNSSADVQAQEAKISVTKTANPAVGSPSTNVTFTLLVRNTGSASLQHVFVSDLLPAGLSYVSSTSGSTHAGQSVYWSDIGPLSPSANKSLQVVAHIDGPITGTRNLTNHVAVSGKPENGQNVTSNSSADVQAQEAKISVTKTANPAVGSPSTNVTFTLLVRNTGSASLQHVFVSDLLPAGLSYVSSTSGSTHAGQSVYWSDIGPLSPSANKSLQVVAHIDGPITGTRNLTNHVAVSGKPENGQNVTSSSSADVQAQEAKISVTKTANPAVGSPSTNVTFTLLVRNTGSATLQHVFVSDLLPAGMSYVSSTSGSVNVGQNVYWSDIGPLSSSANKSLQIVAHIDGPITGTRNLTNHVDVSGKPENGQNVTSNSSAYVLAQEARISVTKTANPAVGSPSTNVTFTLLVRNTGSAALQHVFVSDLLPAGMSYVSSTSGSVNVGQSVYWSDIGPLSPSVNKSLQIVAHIDGPITGTRNLTNHVTVSGKPENGQNVTSNSSADVQAQEAKISVTKTANPAVGSPSTNVTFTLLVRNTGSATLQHVFVSDLLPAGLSYVSSTSGSVNVGQNVYWSDIGPLSSSANKSLQIVAHIDGPITGTRNLTNHVAVSGKPENGQNVTSNSSADVRAQEAKISITKTANPTFGTPGTNVTFTLLIRNTGSATLDHVFVSDLLPAGMTYVSSSSGSTNVGKNVSWSDVGPILSGANKSLQIVAHIDGPIIGTHNLTNHVDVSGKPENGQNVTSNSSADVQAQEAKISVTKTANPIVGSPSTNVTFTLLVRNTGSASLQHVFVSDLLPAGMSYVSSTSGSVNVGQNVYWSDIGPLSPSANKSMQIVAHIDGPITGTRNLTNNVAVSGKPENGQNVTSNSSADVQAQEAKISVTKTANPTVGSPSTNVTFTLLVRNTGSATLDHVFVSDLLPAGMSYVSSTSGSVNVGQNVYWSDVGPLSSSANKSLQIVAHIDGPITGTRNLTNHVDVSGKPENGQNVTSNSSADVQAQEARISVTKTANPTFGTPGTNVTFTLLIRNTGSASLQHVFVSDLLPAGMTYVSSSSGSTNVGKNVSWSDVGPILSGANKSLQIVAYIDGSISGTHNLTNNVAVSGKPENGLNVTSNSSADVQAQEARISVTKTANPAIGSPSTNVTFTLLVRNTGSATLDHVFVSDLLPAGLSYVSSTSGSVNVGQNVYWSDIGPLSSSANKSLQIVAHIDGPITGTRNLTNHVAVSGKPGNGQNVTSNSSADVQIQEARISVTKTANPAVGSPSTNVTFTLLVRNTGSATLQHVFVSDLLPAGMSYVSSTSGSVNVGQNVYWSDVGPLSPSVNKSLQIVAHIDGPITGTRNLTNNVAVSGKPENGQNVTSNSSADVQAQEAKISVTKTANPTSGTPGTNVTFTLLVRNTGGASLQHVFVSDLLPAGMTYVSSSPGSTNVGKNVSWSDIGPLTSGDEESLQIVAYIDGSISGTHNLTNHVDVSGKPENGQNVTSDASADVQAQEARISVTKTANPTFGTPGTNITFTLVVKNTGSAVLQHVFVSDLLPVGINYVSSTSGSVHAGQNVSWADIGPLSSDENKSLQILANIDGSITGTHNLTNHVDVSGKPENGRNVTSNSSADVQAQEARIAVTKTANPAVGSPSTNVTFTLLVRNTGSAALQHIFVRDLLPAGLSYVSSTSGSVNVGQDVYWSDIGPLSSGGNKSLQIVAHIDGPITGTRNLTNHVAVSGKPENGQNVTSNSSADVQAQEARISIAKTANPAVGSPSTNVTFTLLVRNTGSATLQHVFVSDLLPAGMSYVSSTSGSVKVGQNVYWSDVGLLSSGANKSLQIVAHIDGPITGTRNLTNHVAVSGKPENGQNVTSNSSADVHAQEAKISVTKTANPTAGTPGTDVTFNLVINNTGSSDLQHVFVRDLLPAGMTYVSSTTGGVHAGQNVSWSDIGPILSGNEKLLHIVAFIDESISGTHNLTNHVDVSGKPANGQNVTSNSSADVQAQESNISVTKTANPTSGSPSTDVTFTLLVKNTGSSALQHVFVSDLLPVGMTYVSSTSGSTNVGQNVFWSDIGPLTSGDEESLQIVAHVNDSLTGTQTLTNNVDVSGKHENDKNVSDNASANFLVQEASVSVTKTANPTVGSPGMAVTFTLNIKNTGKSALTHSFVSDLLPDGMSYVSSTDGGRNSGRYINWTDLGYLAINDTKTLSIEAKIDDSVSGTLTNTVGVESKPEHGENVTSSSTADVVSQISGMEVEKTAIPDDGYRGTVVTFPINITNNEAVKLAHVKAVDVLPLGMDYEPDGSIPSPTSAVQTGGRWVVTWDDLGPLNSSQSHNLILKSRITGTVLGTLTNKVNTTGIPEFGNDVIAGDTAEVVVSNAGLNITKEASQTDGVPGTTINYTITINNTGPVEFCQLSSQDILPEGLSYIGDDHGGVLAGPNLITWNNLGCLLPGEKIVIELEASITGTVLGKLDNQVSVQGRRQSDGALMEDESRKEVEARSAPFIITKTSDKSTYRPGEEMTYTITVCNPLEFISLTDVIVKDAFQNPGVKILATYPEPNEVGQWYFSEIPPKSCVKMTLVAVLPESNTTFDMLQSVSGRGFVNVHNDLSTGTPSFSVTNCVYVTAKVGPESWSRQKCLSVAIREIGTKLATREHGSGNYVTDETTKMVTKNRSIESQKSVSAVYYPTDFQLPNNNELNFSSKWTEEVRGKNSVTGATMHEAYRYATSLDRNSYIKMDENGSEMNVESSFDGMGSIGFVKKSSPEDGPKVKPVFESQESYSGRFQLNESFEEYGANVATEKSASGVGYVAANKRLHDSQKTSESGTGAYKSEEKTDTFTNYIAKDIELVHKPASFNYSQSGQGNQDLKWSESMSSKSGVLRGGDIVADKDSTGGKVAEGCMPNNGTAPATLISEKYSSLEYLKKDAVALGLNEMKSNATFQGVADYRAKVVGSNATHEVDNEERYVGEYGVSRHILLTGVSRYDQPHVAVTKEGELKSEWYNRVNTTVAEYAITVTNDGNKALDPVYVRDLFPPGTQYISSSIKPTTLSSSDANWTILHLGIGNTFTINLKLNVTEYAPSNILNRVEVGGLAGDTFVSAANYSYLEPGWLNCCQPSVAVKKSAQLDTQDPSMVHYTIMVKNNANSIMAARLTDQLPGDMSFLGASLTPESYDANYINWVLPQLNPNEILTIEYNVHVARNGGYTNNVHLDASAVGGDGSDTADASAYVYVTGTGVEPKTARYDGWQPPDWNLNTSEEGISI